MRYGYMLRHPSESECEFCCSALFPPRFFAWLVRFSAVVRRLLNHQTRSIDMFSPYFRAAGLTLAAALFFMCPPNRAIAQDANRDTVYTKTDVGDLVQRVAKRSGDFKSAFNRAVEHTMDGTKLEERAKHRADDLHDAAKKMQDVFG